MWAAGRPLCCLASQCGPILRLVPLPPLALASALLDPPVFLRACASTPPVMRRRRPLLRLALLPAQRPVPSAAPCMTGLGVAAWVVPKRLPGATCSQAWVCLALALAAAASTSRRSLRRAAPVPPLHPRPPATSSPLLVLVVCRLPPPRRRPASPLPPLPQPQPLPAAAAPRPVCAACWTGSTRAPPRAGHG